MDQAWDDPTIMIHLHSKGIQYKNLSIHLCNYWNTVVDIFGGPNSPHMPENGLECQKTFLNILTWFST